MNDDKAYDANETIEQKIKRVLRRWSIDPSSKNHEYAGEIAELMINRYFYIPSNGRNKLLKEGNFGTLIEVSWDVIEQEVRIMFGDRRTSDSALFWRSKDGDFAAKDLLLHIANQEYRPLQTRFFQKGGALVLNRWKPSGLEHIGSPKEDEGPADLGPWEEFLERMFPKPEQRKYFEEWLAVTVVRPDKRIVGIPLIRSDQGTGKDFFANEILGPLVGVDNYKNGSVEHLTATHAEEVWFSTATVINELYKGKSKVIANQLKSLLNAPTQQINPKGLPAFRMSVSTNFIIFSNSDAPIYIEEDDRRYWVPQRVVHWMNRKETNGFLQERLLPWIRTGGLSAIRFRLQEVMHDLPDRHFDEAPDTEEKDEIKHIDMKPSWKEELQAELEQARGDWYSLDRIKDWDCVKNKLNQPEILAILKQEGWGWKRKDKGRRWGYMPKAD